MTEKLTVASSGTYTQWLALGTKVADVQEPDDDSTSYIYISTQTLRESYLLAASAIPVGSTINSIAVSARITGRFGYDGGIRSFLRLNGSNSDGPQNLTTVWSTYLDVITRPGGGSWALSDLATLEIGVLADTPFGFPACTTLFAIIDYTPPVATTGDMLMVF